MMCLHSVAILAQAPEDWPLSVCQAVLSLLRCHGGEEEANGTQTAATVQVAATPAAPAIAATGRCACCEGRSTGTDPGMAPQDSQSDPKMAQDGQDHPKMTKMTSRWPHYDPKMALRWPQDGPNIAQDGPKMSPKKALRSPI
jgi:hypothetical protein